MSYRGQNGQAEKFILNSERREERQPHRTKSAITLLAVRSDGYVGMRADRDHLSAVERYRALVAPNTLERTPTSEWDAGGQDYVVIVVAMERCGDLVAGAEGQSYAIMNRDSTNQESGR